MLCIDLHANPIPAAIALRPDASRSCVARRYSEERENGAFFHTLQFDD
jgi:hypothetical protein